jgi:hypothetical protein
MAVAVLAGPAGEEEAGTCGPPASLRTADRTLLAQSTLMTLPAKHHVQPSSCISEWFEDCRDADFIFVIAPAALIVKLTHQQQLGPCGTPAGNVLQLFLEVQTIQSCANAATPAG